MDTTTAAATLSAVELMTYYRRGDISPVDVVEECLDRIKRLDPPQGGAFTQVLAYGARVQAAEAAWRYNTGQARRLEGVPIAVKDLFDFVAGQPNTFGSTLFRDRIEWIADHDSVYVARLRAAGAIIIGRTATSEFGHKGLSDTFESGTVNPFDPSCNTGGSSGGSAAAVAAGFCHIATGSDAGGSIRIPAAMCGVVGIKLTHGRIPQDVPVLSHSPFLHVGPIARTAADAALAADIMAGAHSPDPLAVPGSCDLTAGLRQDLSGARVAFTPDWNTFPIEDTMAHTIRASLQALRHGGACVDEDVPTGLDTLRVTHPDGRWWPYTHHDGAKLWTDMQSVLYGHVHDMLKQPAPYGAGIDLYDHTDILTDSFTSMIDRAYEIGAVEYRHGELLRTAGANGYNGINQRIEHLLTEYEFVASPTVAVSRVPHTPGQPSTGPTRIGQTSVEPHIGWCPTYLTNFSGHPSITVPAGTINGMPAGIHIIARRWHDTDLIAAAAAIEKHQPWHHHYPASP